jgi:hypothetical protein
MADLLCETMTFDEDDIYIVRDYIVRDTNSQLDERRQALAIRSRAI